MADQHEDIYELFQKVRKHPDFLFGTIFTTDDLSGRDMENPDDPYLHADDGDDRMCEAGNEFLDYWLGFAPDPDTPSCQACGSIEHLEGSCEPE